MVHPESFSRTLFSRTSSAVKIPSSVSSLPISNFSQFVTNTIVNGFSESTQLSSHSDSITLLLEDVLMCSQDHFGSVSSSHFSNVQQTGFFWNLFDASKLAGYEDRSCLPCNASPPPCSVACSSSGLRTLLVSVFQIRYSQRANSFFSKLESLSRPIFNSSSLILSWAVPFDAV